MAVPVRIKLLGKLFDTPKVFPGLDIFTTTMDGSKVNVALGTTLNALKALGIPYVQRLVDIALHIYNTAQSIKNNKRDVVQLIERIGVLVCKVADRHSEDGSTAEQQQDIEQFLDTLSTIDEFLTVMSNRRFLQRCIYHDEDRESLRTFKESLADAKMDYLFSSMLLMKRDRQEAAYRVYKREELEFDHVVKLGPVRHEVAYVTHREGSRKVLVQRYTGESKRKFLSDLQTLVELDHPHFSFLGASPSLSPVPFIIFEKANFRPAHSFLHDIVQRDPKNLLPTAIIMITDFLAAYAHWESLNYPPEVIRTTWSSSVLYNGRKLIIDVEPPRSRRVPNVVTIMGVTFDLNDIMIDHVEVILDMLGLKPTPDEVMWGIIDDPYLTPDDPLWPLRPIWQSFHYNFCYHSTYAIFQNIREEMDRNSLMSIATLRSSLLAQEALLRPEDLPPNPLGHIDGIQPGDVGYYSSGTFIRVANILPDLLNEKIISVEPVMTRVDHTFEANCVTRSESLANGGLLHIVPIAHPLCELELIAEYELALYDGTSLRSRLQTYFLDQLPSLIRQHLPSEVATARNLILVTSVVEQRTALFNQPCMPQVPCFVVFQEYKDPEPSGKWGCWYCSDVPPVSVLPIDRDLCEFNVTPAWRIECVLAEYDPTVLEWSL